MGSRLVLSDTVAAMGSGAGAAARAAFVGLCLLSAAGCRRAEGAERVDGSEVFRTACARCHGTDGAGGPPSLGGRAAPRNFRDAAFQASRTDDQLHAAIRSGTGTGMPAFAAALGEEQIAAVVRVVRSFDPRGGHP